MCQTLSGKLSGTYHFVLRTLCSRFCYRPHCRGEETGLVVSWTSLTSPMQRMHFCFWNPISTFCASPTRHTAHSPIQAVTQASSHPLWSTGNFLEMGLPYSHGTAKADAATAYQGPLGSFSDKTQQRPGPYTLEVLGVGWCSRTFSLRRLSGAVDTH